MRNLIDIIGNIGGHEVVGNIDIPINAIEIDSRKVSPGALYIAVPGVTVDGHSFIAQAIENGAVAVLCQDIPMDVEDNVCYIKVENTQDKAGILASAFYHFPSRHLKLVGVTGTNGKTTTTSLMYQLFTDLGYKVGLISTVEYRIADKKYDSTHTTPDPISLQALMAEMKEAGCSHVFMEVSSHAIDQDRISGLEFDGAVFTNLSRDHLDYHKTVDEYIAAKKKFFDNLEQVAFALSNKDDKRGKVMLQNTAASKHFYSVNGTGEFNAKLIENTFEGMHLVINNKDVYTPLVGKFNAYNFMATYGVAVLLDENPDDFLPILSSLTPAEGRFDYIISPNEKIIGIVDYAHTPDALENVLTTIGDAARPEQNIITVVGCGGDRDKGKRPDMGNIASTMSDVSIFTSDNPRSEEPIQIIEDMMQGVKTDMRKNLYIQTDRKEAIRMACALAKPKDVILVAGKGHEKYQEINGQKTAFDDKKVLADVFKEQNL